VFFGWSLRGCRVGGFWVASSPHHPAAFEFDGESLFLNALIALALGGLTTYPGAALAPSWGDSSSSSSSSTGRSVSPSPLRILSSNHLRRWACFDSIVMVIILLILHERFAGKKDKYSELRRGLAPAKTLIRNIMTSTSFSQKIAHHLFLWHSHPLPLSLACSMAHRPSPCGITNPAIPNLHRALHRDIILASTPELRLIFGITGMLSFVTLVLRRGCYRQVLPSRVLACPAATLGWSSRCHCASHPVGLVLPRVQGIPLRWSHWASPRFSHRCDVERMKNIRFGCRLAGYDRA